MRVTYHSSLLDRILSMTDVVSVALSPSDFHSVHGEVMRGYYDHNQYQDYQRDCLESIESFEVGGITIELDVNEEDVE